MTPIHRFSGSCVSATQRAPSSTPWRMGSQHSTDWNLNWTHPFAVTVRTDDAHEHYRTTCPHCGQVYIDEAEEVSPGALALRRHRSATS